MKTARTAIAATSTAAVLLGLGSFAVRVADPTTAATRDTTASTTSSSVTSSEAEHQGYGHADDTATKVYALHRYGETSQANGQTSWASMNEMMTFAIQDIDTFWSSVFAGAGYTQPSVTYTWTMPGESVSTSCAPGYTTDQTAGYCDGDDTIVVSQQMMTEIWNGSYVGPDHQTIDHGGDFAVATVLAHEYAHNLQHELGLDATHTVPQIEKQADCLAGIWARDAARRNLIDPGDIDEAGKVMYLVGDTDFTSPAHHGTPGRAAGGVRPRLRDRFRRLVRHLPRQLRSHRSRPSGAVAPRGPRRPCHLRGRAESRAGTEGHDA